MTTKLRLKAETTDDLAVFSAALQDAILRVGEINFSAKARSFTLRLSRYRHEAGGKQRVLTGLRFDGVMSVSSKGIVRDDPEALAVLIALSFESEKNGPGGVVHLIFAGAGEILLTVECVDAVLADVSEPRSTKSQPLHPA